MAVEQRWHAGLARRRFDTSQEAALDQEDGPSPIDVHVGLRLRALRKVRGISQDSLAKSIGISFQQVQKYEKGTNRISASKLFAAAQLLGYNVSDFYEGLRQPAASENIDQALYQALAIDPSLSRALTFLSRLESPRKRQLAFELIEVLANDP